MYVVSNWQNIATAQDNATTCWLTCYEMMFKWRGIEHKGIDKILENVGIKMFDGESNGAKETGLKAKDYTTANGALGLQSLVGGEWDEYTLEYTLGKKGPIWSTMRFGSGNHNVVIIGCGDGKVKYINPWWEIEKKADVVTSPLKSLNLALKHFNGWKGANACWP